ncbi:MAG: FAD-binding oxidoreductase [Fimbriiglobus sp.]
MSDQLTIDGFGPLPLRRPDSVAALGEFVREAADANLGIYPVGGRTTLDLGLPPTKPGFAVDTRGLSAVIDYPARDMTVTVQAGITVGELQAMLAKEGQRLPVDVPAADRATLGGALAANRSGPRRLGRGTLRDYVIGIGFMTDAGDEVKGGGRVVKNVAGYDLMKLQVGALGTLGVITFVTLKVFPKPEDQTILAFGVNAASVGPTLDRLHTSASRPAAVELLNTAAAKRVATAAGVALPDEEPWVVLAGFEEKATTVAWQVATLRDELKSAPARGVAEFRGLACEPLWAALTNEAQSGPAPMVWKASVLPSKFGEFVRRVTMESEFAVFAHALNGVAWLHAPAGFDPAAGTAVGVLEQAATATGGTVVVQRCPPEWKAKLRVWGRPGNDHAVMRVVKSTVDPKNIFNPGRLFGDG